MCLRRSRVKQGLGEGPWPAQTCPIKQCCSNIIPTIALEESISIKSSKDILQLCIFYLKLFGNLKLATFISPLQFFLKQRLVQCCICLLQSTELLSNSALLLLNIALQINRSIVPIWKERFCQRLHQRSLFTFTVWVQGAGLPRRAYQATVFSSWRLFESVYVFRKIKLWPHFKASLSLSLSLSLSTHIYIFTLQKPLIEKGQMQTPQVLMVSKYTRFHHTRILRLAILHSKNGRNNTTKKSFLLFLDDLSPTNLFRSTKRNSIWSSCTLIENTVISLHIVYV